jgi:DNA-3-methyladenine glycosylase
MIQPLRRAELPEASVDLARNLLGAIVVRETAEGLMAGRIVETEAYLPGDPASHAWKKRTRRNAAMFLAHGHAYVYLAYGTSFMLNVSSEAEGIGAGVLVRALHPLSGLAQMQANRPASRLRDLTRGPGRLAAALAVDRTLDGIDLCLGTGPLWLGTDRHRPARIGASVRIGITRAADEVLRFYVAGDPNVSGPGRLNRPGRDETV